MEPATNVKHLPSTSEPLGLRGFPSWTSSCLGHHEIHPYAVRVLCCDSRIGDSPSQRAGWGVGRAIIILSYADEIQEKPLWGEPTLGPHFAVLFRVALDIALQDGCYCFCFPGRERTRKTEVTQGHTPDSAESQGSKATREAEGMVNHYNITEALQQLVTKRGNLNLYDTRNRSFNTPIAPKCQDYFNTVRDMNQNI